MNAQRNFPIDERAPGAVPEHLSEQAERAVRDALRAETRERGPHARLYAGSAAAGLLGGGALTACLVLALAEAMPGWAAALIVGVALVALAVLLKNAARTRPHALVRSADPPVPYAVPDRLVPGTAVDGAEAPHHRA
jgi:hypothetical protein